ncbi:MAG: HNH endonuclease [Verrucomicrobiota bacterium]
MDSATVELVRQRSAHRCPQSASVLRFHIEHIIARQHGGSDDAANLALACPECNYQKGTNLTGIDPDTGNVTPLFHPRHEWWEAHFKRDGARLMGITAIGRTTVWLLAMNTGDRLRWREMLLRLGRLE